MFPLWEQETSCCSERLKRLPVEMALADSTTAVAEKAQHEPQLAWFLTGLTMLGTFLQSTSVASLSM